MQGLKGDKGDTGNTGQTGAPGVGVPTGGTTGQLLAKSSNVDYATHWIAPPAAGGTGDVVGPAASVDNRVVFFSGTTGKLIKDSGLTLSGTNTGDQTSVSGNAGTATTLATPRNIDGQAFNGSADITVIAPATVAATAKTTPVDADVLPMVDSAASNVLKKLSWASIKATLKAYFDTLYAPVGGGGGGGAAMVSSILSATQANSTVTPAVVTGHTFTIAAGQVLTLQGQLIFTGAATTTGLGFGIRVAQSAGASANARGSWMGRVMLTSAAAATALEDGDAFNVAAGANAYSELLGTATTAGNNAASYQATIHNPSAAGTTTVTIEFRSEVAGSAITLQIGTGCIGVKG